jgi:hypothetical protein
MSLTKPDPEVVNHDGAAKVESEESEGEESYYDSGLPPPSPFSRRSSTGEDAFPVPKLPRSVSEGQLDEMQDRGFQRRFPGLLQAKGPYFASTSTSDSDVFAERKKKLTSRVMTLSMPDLRNVRAQYNKGIGKSMRSRSSQNLQEQDICTNFDSTFDSLLSEIQDETGQDQ